jgi:CheY-like chemotaxis protein
MGRGTGLGLASVYGIIKNHGGYIDVESQKGRGSRFTIYLPASESKTAPQRIRREALKTGSENVLLVDDEAMILDVGTRMLEHLGYQVFPAASGHEAIQVFEAKRGGIDLVILDMIMPNLSGEETYARLKSMEPGVKVLLASGYSLDDQASEILKQGCSGFIQKPFNLEELSEKIRSVLQSSGPISPV